MQETPPGPQQLLLQEIATELFETDFRPDKRGERLRYTLTPAFPLLATHMCYAGMSSSQVELVPPSEWKFKQSPFHLS